VSEESAVDPVAPVASPCTGVCRLDPATGWCVGCLRSLDEIAAWGTLDDAARRQVLDRVAVRRVSRS
jgi:predicted Fe-S protein YdhL (DUF1289 family)